MLFCYIHEHLFKKLHLDAAVIFNFQLSTDLKTIHEKITNKNNSLSVQLHLSEFLSFKAMYNCLCEHINSYTQP